MKFRKLFIALTAMFVSFGASVAAMTSFHNKAAEVAYAVDDGYQYITGTSDALDGWANAGQYAMSTSSDGGFYYYLNLPLKNGTEFKITNKTWNNTKGAWLVTNHSSGTFGGNDNIVCSTAANYDIAWDGSNIHIWNAGGIDTSYTGWVIAGQGSAFSGPNWSPGSAIHMTTPGDDGDIAKIMNVSFGASDQFRIAYSQGCKFSDDGWKTWTEYTSGFTKPGDNLVVTNAGLVSARLDSSYNGHASYSSGTYTITYDRNNNGESSVTTTQTKTYGVNYTIANPTTFSWTPSTDKRFVHWNTARNDCGTTYNKGATYSTDQGLTLYYIEDWYNYRYKINNGSWITLTHNDTNKPSGVKVQFQSSSQTLPLNGILTFQYSTDGGSNWSALTIGSYEGNYDVSTGIKMQTTDTLYLKLNDNSSYTVWVPGISDRSIAVCATKNATSGTTYGMRSNGYTETVTSSYVYIKKGQYIRRGYTGTLYDTYLVSGGASSYFTQQKEGSTNVSVLCNMTGAYTIYNQAGEYSSWADIYIERNEAESAKYLAQLFNSDVSVVCTGITGGTKSLSDLQNIWYSNTSSNMYKNFNGQPSTTLAYFKASTPSDSDILACVTRYNYILNKYGTSALSNFLGRTDSYRAAIGINSPLTILVGNNNASIVVIIVSSVLVTAGVGGYFLLRKRKEQ